MAGLGYPDNHTKREKDDHHWNRDKDERHGGGVIDIGAATDLMHLGPPEISAPSFIALGALKRGVVLQ